MRRARPSPGVIAASAVLALASVPGLSCSGAPDGSSTLLARLERMAFVPPGTCVLLPDTLRVDCSTQRALLVDRFEITRGEWLAWLDERGEDVPARRSLAFWPKGPALLHPATGMTLEEARAFAAGEGLRLLTAREWVRVAVGTRAQEWPWGPFPAKSVTNTLDLRLSRLAPVGTFESGSTSLGVYDLLGNAAEWVEGLIPAPDGRTTDERTWVMGGSYLSHKRPIYLPEKGDALQVGFNAVVLDPRARTRDVGFRVAAEAREWLLAHAADLPVGASARERLEAIGARWGRSAVPLLRELAEGSPAPSLARLLAGAQR